VSYTWGSWDGVKGSCIENNGFNLSGTNCGALLRCLGLRPPGDWSGDWGQVRVEEARERAECALMDYQPDEYDREWRGVQYLPKRFADVLELCDQAKSLGHPWLVWG
jgi:hypothetical protein